MNASQSAPGGRGNPFATRHIRPGVIPPLDTNGRPLDVEGLIGSLASLGGLAALVGPHGSGKTTLLWHLAAALEARGSRVERVRLRGARDLAGLVRALVRCAGGGAVCVDSWERLGGTGAWALAAVARLCSVRLVVTAHRRGPLPTLRACRTTAPLLQAIVQRLPNCRLGAAPAAPAAVEEAFRDAGGDVREALFLLYDRFEERVRSSAG